MACALVFRNALGLDHRLIAHVVLVVVFARTALFDLERRILHIRIGDGCSDGAVPSSRALEFTPLPSPPAPPALLN